jgi:hypothetical protein
MSNILSGADSRCMAHIWVDNASARTLAELELHELSISTRRRELHRRIDVLSINAPLTAEQIALLDLLEDEERQISTQRRRLHEHVDELRVHAGLPTHRRNGPSASTGPSTDRSPRTR